MNKILDIDEICSSNLDYLDNIEDIFSWFSDEDINSIISNLDCDGSLEIKGKTFESIKQILLNKIISDTNNKQLAIFYGSLFWNLSIDIDLNDISSVWIIVLSEWFELEEYELLKNFLLSDEYIIQLIEKEIDLKIVLENINLCLEYWYKPTLQLIYDLRNNKITQEELNILLLNKTTNIYDVRFMLLYWVNSEIIEQLISEHPELFDFFEWFDIPFHYVVQFAISDFPVSDYIWHESIFTFENVYYIISLFNRSKIWINNLTSEDIIFYFETYWEKIQNEDNNDNSHIYIEQIHDIIWWDISVVENMLKSNPELLILDILEELKRQVPNDKVVVYRKILWDYINNYSDYDIYSWFILNDLSPESLLPYFAIENNFDIKDIWILASDYNWTFWGVVLPTETRIEIINKYLEINRKFWWADVISLLSRWLWLHELFENWVNNKEEIIFEYVNLNDNFSWNDIVDLCVYFSWQDWDNFSYTLPESIKDFISELINIVWNDLSAGAVINIYEYIEWGGSLDKLIELKWIIEHKSIKVTNEQLSAIIKIIWNDFDFDEIEKQLNKFMWGYSDEELILAISNWVKISDYEWLISSAEGSILSLITITDYIKLYSNWFTDEHIKELWQNFFGLNELSLPDQEKVFQFVNNLLDLWSQDWFFELIWYLFNNKDITINIWDNKKTIYWNIQLLMLLLSYYKEFVIDNSNWDEIDWTLVIKWYEDVLNEYINVSKQIDKIYFMSSNHYYWEDHSASQYRYKGVLQQIYSWVSQFIDYTAWLNEWKTISTPSEMIDILEQDLKDNPNINIMLFISLHWNLNWEAYTSRWYFKREDFERINKIASEYLNLKIVIDSCYNSKKFNNLDISWNVISTSWNFYSLDTFLQYMWDAKDLDSSWYMKWDFNKDWSLSPNEIDLFSTLSYREWRIFNNNPISYFRNSQWRVQQIDSWIIGTIGE